MQIWDHKNLRRHHNRFIKSWSENVSHDFTFWTYLESANSGTFLIFFELLRIWSVVGAHVLGILRQSEEILYMEGSISKNIPSGKICNVELLHCLQTLCL